MKYDTSPHDSGLLDRHYGRPHSPNYIIVGTLITGDALTAKEVAEYDEGYYGKERS